jgi:hypothetical protein
MCMARATTQLRSLALGLWARRWPATWPVPGCVGAQCGLHRARRAVGESGGTFASEFLARPGSQWR